MEIYSPVHKYEVSLTQAEQNILEECIALLTAITDSMYKYNCDVCEYGYDEQILHEGEICDIREQLRNIRDINYIKEL
jgi:hypothetical protein